ncbi:thiolase family protein, partial [Agrilactobacillus yilanensis]
MNQVYIVAGARLLIGKYGGQLAAVEPEQLGAYLLKKLLKQNHFSGAAIDEVIVGNVIGGGGNVGRRIALASALPVTVPAFTIDRQCASGLESILTATAKIKSGFADCIVSGGVESTSRAPWLIRRPKKLYGQNPEILARAPLSVAPYGDPEMGIACEQLAQRQQISRLQQDQYAYRSQQHYQTALTQGVFEDELIPYEAMTQDESPRPQTTMAKLSTLPAAFKPDGQLTAGNSSPLNDGAAFLILASAAFCKQKHLTPLFEVMDGVSVGIEPVNFGLGPVAATSKLLQRNQLTLA